MPSGLILAHGKEGQMGGQGMNGLAPGCYQLLWSAPRSIGGWPEVAGMTAVAVQLQGRAGCGLQTFASSHVAATGVNRCGVQPKEC